MAQFLRPNLGEKLLSAETAVEEHSKEMLTVHLRGEDIHVKPQYEVNQPPCSMYKKILSEHEYQSVMVVQVGTTACDDYFKELRKVITVHKPNTGSVVKDFAQLMRARTVGMLYSFPRNLALSFSSFALSAALLSKDVEVLYRRRDAEWESVLHSILNCNDKFQRFYHEHTICKKLESRLDRQALALTILTAVEVFCCTFFDSLYYTGLGNPSWRGDSDGFARLPIFLACRGLIWLIIWIWQRLARVNSRLLRHPQEDPPKMSEQHVGDDGQDPWSACWNFVEQKRDEWQAECQACEDACECDYWRKEEAARRECMDDYCTRFVSGGDTGSLYRWGCIYPRMSFLDSRKADCLAECQATGGPNPVAPKSCRAQLNPATATEDEAGLPGQTGGCVAASLKAMTSERTESPTCPHRPMDPAASLSAKTRWTAASTIRLFSAENAGERNPNWNNKLPKRTMQCWNWLEVEQMSVWDKCKGRFDTFQEQFRACMDSKWATCSGLGCLRIHRECRDSEDPVFKEMSCGGCDGEWSSYSARQLYCAEDLSNPKCRWDETTQTTQSQACAPSCMWEVCQKAFNECQINGGTLAACNDQIISMNQCRECYFVSCEAKCSEGACDAAFSSRDQAYRECAACDDTVACNPNSPCYGDNGDSSCNWLWKPEFGTSCPILCEESIRICQESVQGHCHKWLEDQEKSMWDICHEEYDQYRPQMDECIATGTDAAEPRRLLNCWARVDNARKCEWNEYSFKMCSLSMAEAKAQLETLELKVVNLWRQGNRLRNEARNKRQQLQKLSTSSKGVRFDAVLQRRNLLEDEHSKLQKRYVLLAQQHQETLGRWLKLGGVASDGPVATHGRRLNEGPTTVELGCSTQDCTTQSNLCDAFFNRGGTAEEFIDSLVESHSYDVLPWDSADQICQHMGEMCFMSLGDAETAVRDATYSSNDKIPWTAGGGPDMTQAELDSCVCDTCSDLSTDLNYDTCQSCCQCDTTSAGYYAYIRHQWNLAQGKCDLLGRAIRRSGLYEYSVWTDFDEKLLGGAGGSVPRNPLRAPKTEVGTEVGTWVGEVTHQDPPNRELAHRGACVYRIDIWQVAKIPDICHDPSCYVSPERDVQCKRPEATQAMCPSPFTWQFFKSTREWREGTLSTRSTCEAESCYPQPWIRTQAECATVSHCHTDCPYCETENYWDWESKKGKVWLLNGTPL
eukprot:g13898.t1